MKSSQQIILATIMRKQGGSGVQTYVNSFHNYLLQKGINSSIITPFSFSSVVIFPVFALRKLIDPIKGEWSVWWYQHWHYYFLKRVLKRKLKKNADAGIHTIVHTQCPFSAKAALECRRTSDQKVFMIVHFNISQADEWVDKGEIKKKSKLYKSMKRLEKTVIPQLDGIVYVSQFMKKIIGETVPQAKSVPSACLPLFTNKLQLSSLDNSPRDLINIGSLEKRKNQAYLLHVLARAKQKGYSYSLTLIGEGPNRQKLENISEELGITNQVLFLGYQKNAARFLHNHRVYVHGALMDNLPLALHEALACNLPILAGAVGGIPEIFSDGVEGFYWPLDEPETGAEILIQLMENRQLYLRQIEACKKRYSYHFQTDVVAQKHLHFLLKD